MGNFRDRGPLNRGVSGMFGNYFGNLGEDMVRKANQSYIVRFAHGLWLLIVIYNGESSPVTFLAARAK